MRSQLSIQSAEALKQINIPAEIDAGRKALSDKDYDLAASIAAALVLPTLGAWTNKRKQAWATARRYMADYGRCFDYTVKAIAKLKSVEEVLLPYLTIPPKPQGE